MSIFCSPEKLFLHSIFGIKAHIFHKNFHTERLVPALPVLLVTEAERLALLLILAWMPLHGNFFMWSFFRNLVDHCINNNADVLSLSWGQTRDDDMYPIQESVKAELDRLFNEGRNGKGIITCVAAGNEGMYRVNYLGTHPDMITVGASTSRDTQAGYSNCGLHLTVVAPGGDWPILAPKVSWTSSHWYSPEMPSNDPKFFDYTHFTGTSGATPLVVGICALILSVNPELTAQEVKRILIHTADKIGHSSEYTNGLLHSLWLRKG